MAFGVEKVKGHEAYAVPLGLGLRVDWLDRRNGAPWGAAAQEAPRTAGLDC